MYFKGISTREIADLREQIYVAYYTLVQISIISKEMIPKVQTYRNARSAISFLHLLDATRVSLRRKTYQREAV